MKVDERTNLVRVKHMLDAANEALSFVEGRARADLDDDRVLVLALLKSIEIVGEAASKITAEFQARYSMIPWSIIIATRNRLVHGYFDIDLDILWNTLLLDLPPLIAKLDKIHRGNK